jgi:hypothetical protein
LIVRLSTSSRRNFERRLKKTQATAISIVVMDPNVRRDSGDGERPIL